MEMKFKQGAVVDKVRAQKIASMDALTTAFPVARVVTGACQYLEAEFVS